MADLKHPRVLDAVAGAVARICAAGKPARILAGDATFAKRCMDLGTTCTAVGVDAGILARQSEQLLAGLR